MTIKPMGESIEHASSERIYASFERIPIFSMIF